MSENSNNWPVGWFRADLCSTKQLTLYLFTFRAATILHNEVKLFMELQFNICIIRVLEYFNVKTFIRTQTIYTKAYEVIQAQN